jgi:hypothetical protein
MEKKDILVLILTMAVLGMSLARKYMKKKNQGFQGNEKANPKSSSFQNIRDDYEPYSK